MISKEDPLKMTKNVCVSVCCMIVLCTFMHYAKKILYYILKL